MSPTPVAPSRSLASLYPLLFVALWSTGFIGAKFGLPDAPPLTFLSWRYAIVLVLMGAVAWRTRAPWPRSARECWHIARVGGPGARSLLGWRVHRHQSRFARWGDRLVVGLQPVLTALGAGVLLGERVRPAQWLALGLGLRRSGAGGGAQSGCFSGQFGLALHARARVVALLAITAGTLYQKRYCPSFDLRTGAVIQFLPSLALTALVAAATETGQVHWTPSFVFAMAWLVLGLCR